MLTPKLAPDISIIRIQCGYISKKNPNPSIINSVWITSPVHRPKEIFDPFFQPSEILVDITNKMSGPGKSVKLIEEIIKSKIVL